MILIVSFYVIICIRGDEMSELLEVCGGCNAKLGPDLLSKVLMGLPNTIRDDVLVGYDSSDDAAVIKISDTEAIILTMDFFPAIVENAYDFGRIAATNALSDIYAMGGEPIAALNIVAYPEDGDTNLLHDILRGGADVVKNAGAALVGGHSIHNKRPIYGLSVIGKAHPDKIWQNNTACEGDVLILTKTLGVGLVTGAARAGVIPSDALKLAIDSMCTLNKTASDILKQYTVHACTDVTGFALSGHLLEMLGNNKDAIIFGESLPILQYALESAQEFCFTAGAQRNRKHAQDKINLFDIPFAYQELMFDPQTSGGLLAAVPLNEADEILCKMHQNNLPAAVIGTINAGTGNIKFII